MRFLRETQNSFAGASLSFGTDFLLLQNRHTVHPVHKLRGIVSLALIAMDGMYAGFAGAKACHEKIRVNRDTH